MNAGFNIKRIFVKYGLFILLVAIIVLLSAVSQDFRKIENILNVVKQISMNGLLAIGMTFVIISGGIDLSVGSMIALSSLVAGSILAIDPENAMSSVYALLAAVMVCGLFGLLNGMCISYLKMPPFVVTLAFMTIIRGVGYVFCDGKPFVIKAAAFKFYGQGYVGPIPTPALILVVMLMLFYLVLHWTKFGRHVYATGGNENAAITSGVDTKKIKLAVYTISGLLAGLAGIILGSRINSGNPTLGQSYELDAIAAVVIGGASLDGGIGKLTGTLFGILTIGIINNAMNLMGVSSYYQMIAKGIIILLAVFMDIKTKTLKVK